MVGYSRIDHNITINTRTQVSCDLQRNKIEITKFARLFAESPVNIFFAESPVNIY